MSNTNILVAATATSVLLAGGASATTLEITVEHNNNTGLFITPLYTAFHDGSFVPFVVGEEASDGLEEIAETGGPGPIAAERSGVAPNSQGAFITGAGGPGPIFPSGFGPGASVGSTILDVDLSMNNQFTFLAMVLPSNDTFIGLETSIDLLADPDFMSTGVFSYGITGLNVYDAGTEVNDPTFGAAFVQNNNIGEGAEENGTVQQAGTDDLAAFLGVTLAPPPNPTADLGPLVGPIDFLGVQSEPFITVTIREVAPVPLPAGMPLLLAGLGAFGIAAKRKRKAN